jgi:hypothetical protein
VPRDDSQTTRKATKGKGEEVNWSNKIEEGRRLTSIRLNGETKLGPQMKKGG